jgi:hypothetical protein
LMNRELDVLAEGNLVSGMFRMSPGETLPSCRFVAS